MPDQPPEKPLEKKDEPKAATPEKKSPVEENPVASEISSKALPNIEPHVYKPETPAATTQTPPPSKELPAEGGAPEHKPSPLEEDDITANEPLFEPEEKSRKKIYIIGAIILLLVLVASILLFMNFNKNKKVEESKVETAQTPEVSSPTEVAEEKPETFDRSKITLEILNGSGVAGAAKKIADNLAALGYQIIEVGNASASEQSQIFISNSLEKYKSEFLKDLEEDFKEATISGELEDSTASARIIIGKN